MFFFFLFLISYNFFSIVSMVHFHSKWASVPIELIGGTSFALFRSLHSTHMRCNSTFNWKCWWFCICLPKWGLLIQWVSFHLANKLTSKLCIDFKGGKYLFWAKDVMSAPVNHIHKKPIIIIIIIIIGHYLLFMVCLFILPPLFCIVWYEILCENVGTWMKQFSSWIFGFVFMSKIKMTILNNLEKSSQLKTVIATHITFPSCWPFIIDCYLILPFVLPNYWINCIVNLHRLNAWCKSHVFFSFFYHINCFFVVVCFSFIFLN